MNCCRSREETRPRQPARAPLPFHLTLLQGELGAPVGKALCGDAYLDAAGDCCSAHFHRRTRQPAVKLRVCREETQMWQPALTPLPTLAALLDRELHAPILKDLRCNAHFNPDQLATGVRQARRKRRTRQPATDTHAGREETRSRQPTLSPLPTLPALLYRELHAPILKEPGSDSHLDLPNARQADLQQRTRQPSTDTRAGREETRPRQPTLSPLLALAALLYCELGASIGQALGGHTQLYFTGDGVSGLRKCRKPDKEYRRQEAEDSRAQGNMPQPFRPILFACQRGGPHVPDRKVDLSSACRFVGN